MLRLLWVVVTMDRSPERSVAASMCGDAPLGAAMQERGAFDKRWTLITNVI